MQQHPPPALPLGSTHPHGNATHSTLRLRDAHDAHVLFQAVRQGHLPLIRKRLTGPEQQALHAGQVFVWADREGSLERWTDGHNWSPSRVRGPFLMYDEMPEDTDAFLRRKQQQKTGERRVKQPRKKRLPPLPGGLSKQTYSATLIQNGIDIQKWHLTAYFKDDGSSDLITVEEDPLLRTIIVPENTFKSSMSRKSKGSSSRRRDSVSEARSFDDADAESDGRSGDLRDSPIEEYSPTRSNTLPSPSLGPYSGPGYDMNGGMGLPWELSTYRQNSTYGSPNDDNGNGSGSSNGSAGSAVTVHGTDVNSRFQFNQTFTNNPFGRGRPMHLEGIHTTFEAPSLTFSSMSPQTDLPVVPRSASLGGVPSTNSQLDWTIGAPLEERRSSFMSIGSSRSTSSQSTSASSKLQNSNSSSPASSLSSGQSPYLNPLGAPTFNPNWPGQSPQLAARVKHEHVNSPLGSVSPIVPSSMPTAYQSQPLPSHLHNHPEHVPSAVPPANLPMKKNTLPPLLPYGPDSALNYPSPTWPGNQGLVSSPMAFNSPGGFGELPDSSTFRLPAPINQQGYFGEDVKPQLHHPKAVTANGVPGSWEASQSASSFDFPYRSGSSSTPSSGDMNLNSPLGSLSGDSQPQQPSYQPSYAAGQYNVPGRGEIFDSVVPNRTTPESEYRGQAWSSSS